jgi:hypothetical protein
LALLIAEEIYEVGPLHGPTHSLNQFSRLTKRQIKPSNPWAIAHQE